MSAIAAIPTRYAGVQFRSRLEARWAAFFDLVGWNWEYEPVDLKGYIPDFILSGLKGQSDDPVVVEVKPIRLRDNIDAVARKAFGAGVSSIGGWFAVVGLDFSRPHPCFTEGGDITIGRLAFRYGPENEIATRPFDLWWYDEWWWVYGGKDSATTPTPEAADQVEMWWREAGNRVQWQPSTSAPLVAREPSAVVVPHPDRELAEIQLELSRAREAGDIRRCRDLVCLIVATRNQNAAVVAALRASLGMRQVEG